MRNERAQGWFHCFKQDETGPVAVVELDDGTVEEWPAAYTRFLDDNRDEAAHE